MLKRQQSALIGIISVFFFGIFGLLGVFTTLEKRLYDFYLGLKPYGERSDLIVFLNVDNKAIAANGVFPWPRSIMADGLLRLKEYDAVAVIFDIEYVDNSPRGVDAVSLGRLPSDYSRTFSQITSSMEDIINSLVSGRLTRTEASLYLWTFIDDERQNLLDRALEITRDNDEYFARSCALYGNTWLTLNLKSIPLEGEQAQRREMTRDLFSYSIKTDVIYYRDIIADILPPIPALARTAQGAGFTNIHVDNDGVRRRVDLVREFGGRWYLQLAFAPLLDFLGSPGMELRGNRLFLYDAVLPSGQTKDIVIPLDRDRRMLLNWPLANFEESYTHFSFATLSNLELEQTYIERVVSELISSENLYSFASMDYDLFEVIVLLIETEALLAAASEQRARALMLTSEHAFEMYISLRNQAWENLYHFKDFDFTRRITMLGAELAKQFPEQADIIMEESILLGEKANNLFISLDSFDTIQSTLKNALKGKFIIIGQTDADTSDIGVNPFHSEYVSVGTQGVVIDTILSEIFIIWLSPLFSVLFCLFTVIILFFLNNFSPALRAALGFISVLLAFVISLFLFFFFRIFLDPLFLVFSLTAAIVFREIFAYVLSDREKQFIRKAFSTYVSSDVVKEIISDPSKFQLGGTKRHMSALFSDLKGFSTISEQLAPEDLVRLINRYLTAASDVILKEKGTIDKFIGDAIVAFFGAPLEMPDHALRACVSAINIKRVEAQLNSSSSDNTSNISFFTRIGIHTGAMVAGNMGTENKMNYTIMGNNVNLAARLESANKQYGTWILTTGSTIDETRGRLLSRKLDRVRVAGINEPVQLYEVIETIDNATDKQKEIVNLFEKAIILFEQREYKNATKIFRQVLEQNPQDGPTELYLKRCKTLPADKWDGVYNL
jgi:adenylate cyclase